MANGELTSIEIVKENFPTQVKEKRPQKLVKPNVLPVLNCLFSALKRNGDEDDTPYCEMPDTPYQTGFYFNNNNGDLAKANTENRPMGRRTLGNSYTQVSFIIHRVYSMHLVII